MRKLVLEVQTSVDGFIADDKGGTNWMIWNWGPDWAWDEALQKYHIALTKSADCILLSKQMAEEGFIAHWENTAKDHKSPQFKFAKHITETAKVVFSTSLNKSIAIPGGWSNTEIAEGNFIKYITMLKNEKGRNILVYGGAAFVSSLIKAELIDEFHVIVNPVILGKGLPIFKTVTKNQMLKLEKATSYQCGVTVLKYASVKS